jgi:hypothetical protein
MCTQQKPGHAVSFLQLRLAEATRSRWIDAVVTASRSDGSIRIAPLDGTAEVELWHHDDLTPHLGVGAPVAMNPLYDVLAAGLLRFSVTSVTSSMH